MMIKNTTEKPSDFYKLKLGEEVKEIFMSAGLIREMASLIGNIDNMNAFYLDSFYQERVILLALYNRDENGEPVEADKNKKLNAYNITTSESEALTDWIGGHLMYFFINGALKLMTTLNDQRDLMIQLQQLQDGILALQGQKQSAGPSQ